MFDIFPNIKYRMLRNQKEYCGIEDPNVFIDQFDNYTKGFNWTKSREGVDYWRNVQRALYGIYSGDDADLDFLLTVLDITQKTLDFFRSFNRENEIYEMKNNLRKYMISKSKAKISDFETLIKTIKLR